MNKIIFVFIALFVSFPVNCYATENARHGVNTPIEQIQKVLLSIDSNSRKLIVSADDCSIDSLFSRHVGYTGLILCESIKELLDWLDFIQGSSIERERIPLNKGKGKRHSKELEFAQAVCSGYAIIRLGIMIIPRNQEMVIKNLKTLDNMMPKITKPYIYSKMEKLKEDYKIYLRILGSMLKEMDKKPEKSSDTTLVPNTKK